MGVRISEIRSKVVGQIQRQKWKVAALCLMAILVSIYLSHSQSGYFSSGSQTYYAKAFADRPAYDECVVRHVVLSRLPLPVTALASFPGSGNTWTRHLIQQLTGLGTRSIYCDRILRNKGFPFECHKDKAYSIVTKTHEQDINDYKKAVVLIRNPYEALMSYFQVMITGHTELASADVLHIEANKKFEKSIERYITFYEAWLVKFKGPVHLLQYSAIKQNMTSELYGLASFLNVDVSTDDVNCTVRLQEGKYHRTGMDDRIMKMRSLYNRAMRKEIQSVIRTVEGFVKQRLNIKINLGDDIGYALERN